MQKLKCITFMSGLHWIAFFSKGQLRSCLNFPFRKNKENFYNVNIEQEFELAYL